MVTGLDYRMLSLNWASAGFFVWFRLHVEIADSSDVSREAGLNIIVDQGTIMNHVNRRCRR